MGWFRRYRFIWLLIAAGTVFAAAESYSNKEAEEVSRMLLADPWQLDLYHVYSVSEFRQQLQMRRHRAFGELAVALRAYAKGRLSLAADGFEKAMQVEGVEVFADAFLPAPLREMMAECRSKAGTVVCEICGGSGLDNCGVCSGSGWKLCRRCKGSGWSGGDRRSGEICGFCGGLTAVKCDNCGGDGAVICKEHFLGSGAKWADEASMRQIKWLAVWSDHLFGGGVDFFGPDALKMAPRIHQSRVKQPTTRKDSRIPPF